MKKLFNYNGHIISFDMGIYTVSLGSKFYYGSRLDAAISFIDNNPITTI